MEVGTNKKNDLLSHDVQRTTTVPLSTVFTDLCPFVIFLVHSITLKISEVYL